MRISPQHNLYADENLDLDWGLILAVEKCITGADIHDGRALLCTYRNAADGLVRNPKSKYYQSQKVMAEVALRKILSTQYTVSQAYQEKRDWWIREGGQLFEEER